MINVRQWRHMVEHSVQTDHKKEFVWLPLPAVMSAWGFVTALVHLAAQTFPEYIVGWWLYPTLIAAAFAGTYAPLFREATSLQVGRFFVGAGWLLLPIVIGSGIGFIQGDLVLNSLLYNGVFPGVFLLTSYSVATMLGDVLSNMFPVGEVDSAYDDAALAARAQNVWHQIIRFLFKKWLFLALLATALVEGVFGISIVLAWPVVLWACFGFLGSLIVLVAVHIAMKRRTWRAVSDELRITRQPTWHHRFPYSLLVVSAVLALMLPANISPIARYGVGTMFGRLSDIIAPLVIPTERSKKPSTNKGEWAEALRQRVIALFDNENATGWLNHVGSPIRVMILLLFIGSGAFAAWRLYRWLRLGPKKERSTTRYAQRGLLAELLYWLRERFRSFIRVLFGVWHDAAGRFMQNEANKTKSKKKKLRDENQSIPEDMGKITQLFIHFLRRLQRLGYPREQSETPREFAKRIAQIRPETADELTNVTELYSEVRYRPKWDAPFLQRTYTQLAQSIKRVLQTIQRKNEGQQQED